MVWVNRAFLRRAVRFLAQEGITQFLDLGSGIPAVGTTHEVAHTSQPEARVVYVDIDPVAVAHAHVLLRSTVGVRAVVGDLVALATSWTTRQFGRV